MNESIAASEAQEASGTAFKRKTISAARPLIDEGVALVLEQLAYGEPLLFECERLLRLGATGTRGRRTRSEDAFRRLGIENKVYFRRELRELGLPPPTKLLAWGQLIGVTAGWLRRDANTSRDSIALEWGFSDGGSCSTRCYHHSDLYPSDIDTMPRLIDALLATWRASRN